MSADRQHCLPLGDRLVRCLSRIGLALAIVVCAMSMMAAEQTSSYVDTILADKPAGYWRLGETSVDNVNELAKDESGNMFDGKYVGNVTPRQKGAIAGDKDTAVLFDGQSGYIVLDNSKELEITGKITLEAWVKSDATDGTHDIIACGPLTTPTNAEVRLRILDGFYCIGSWDGNDHAALAAVPAEDSGKWVYLAGVYDGTNWILYRNGIEVSRHDDAMGAIAVSSGWGIGGGTGAKNDRRYFKGTIDEAAIYDKALTAEQIKAHFTAGIAH